MNDSGGGKILKVLIGQIILTRSPNLLQAVLGSCVGMTIFDPETGLAGMAHVLLPASNDQALSSLPGKFADLAAPRLRNALVERGARPEGLLARIAGGAHMFSSNSMNDGDIGSMNARAVTRALRALDIRILSKDIGGTFGRKVDFSLTSFRYQVETLKRGNINNREGK